MIFTARIKERKEIAKNTWELTIVHDEPNFFFNAGQYVWIITSAGRRAFSITSSSTNTKEFQIIFRGNDKSAIKNYLIDPKNSQITVRGAFGTMRAPVSGGRSIYIAGGVSIAPFLSIIRRMAGDHLRYNIELIFATHEEAEAFYIDELKTILGTKFKHINGKITPEDITIDTLSKYYVFGPKEMVTDVTNTLLSAGVRPQNVIYEENYPTVSMVSPNPDDPSYFKLAVDQSATHIILTDQNGVIIYANPAAQKMTGYSMSDMKGQTPRLWGGQMDANFYQDFWNTIKTNKKTFEGQFNNQRKNGEEYVAKVVVTPIMDKTGELIGFFGFEEDITKVNQMLLDFKVLSEFTVGRELKMMELKKEIDNLKKT